MDGLSPGCVKKFVVEPLSLVTFSRFRPASSKISLLTVRHSAILPHLALERRAEQLTGTCCSAVLLTLYRALGGQCCQSLGSIQESTEVIEN